MKREFLISAFLGFSVFAMGDPNLNAGEAGAGTFAQKTVGSMDANVYGAVYATMHNDDEPWAGPGPMEGRMHDELDEHRLTIDADLPFSEVNWQMLNDLREVALTGDAEYDFLRYMLVHHQGAIGMSEIMLDQGTDEELRDLAAEIIDTKDEQMALMSSLLQQHGSPEPGPDREAVISQYETARELMLRGMGQRGTGAIDRDYAESMIPHNGAAIDMAEVLLQFSDDEELRTVANDIVQQQSQLTQALQGWLEQNFP